MSGPWLGLGALVLGACSSPSGNTNTGSGGSSAGGSGGTHDQDGGAGTAGGTAGTAGGTAGTSGGTAGTSGGTAGTSGGTAGTSGGTAGTAGGTAGTAGGTAGAGGRGGAAGGASGAGGRAGTSGGAGAGGRGGAAGGASGAGGFVAAAHPPLPQVINMGGPVLTAPKVQLIAYSNDPKLTDIEAFLQELTHTPFWGQTTSEYGVGALTILPAIHLAGTPPATITDDTIQKNLLTNTSGANPPWGAWNASTIYLFVFPPTTIEAIQGDDKCCSSYDGYHSAMYTDAAGDTVPYAIGCSCPGYDGANVTDLQERTVAISHELVEASTDPIPGPNTAYGQNDDNDIVWTEVSGGELADMCEFNDDSIYTPPGSTYAIQRSWSNAAALLSQNPCVPHTASTLPYFNSFPALTPISYVDPTGYPFTTQGVSIPIGQSKTIDVNLFSAAPMPGPWTVTVYDYDQLLLGASTPYLGLTLDKNKGINGDTLRLTIKANTADPVLGGEAFIIYSTYGQPGDANFETNVTMGLVTN